VFGWEQMERRGNKIPLTSVLVPLHYWGNLDGKEDECKILNTFTKISLFIFI